MRTYLIADENSANEVGDEGDGRRCTSYQEQMTSSLTVKKRVL